MPIGQMILGDQGYPTRSFLLTPYRMTETQGSQRKSRYNTCVSRTRVIIENVNARLKGMWRCLEHLVCDAKEAPRVVMACVVLHNICLKNKLYDSDQLWAEAAAGGEQAEEGFAAVGADGAATRDAICMWVNREGRHRVMGWNRQQIKLYFGLGLCLQSLQFIRLQRRSYGKDSFQVVDLTGSRYIYTYTTTTHYYQKSNLRIKRHLERITT